VHCRPLNLPLAHLMEKARFTGIGPHRVRASPAGSDRWELPRGPIMAFTWGQIWQVLAPVLPLLLGQHALPAFALCRPFKAEHIAAAISCAISHYFSILLRTRSMGGGGPAHRLPMRHAAYFLRAQQNDRPLAYMARDFLEWTTLEGPPRTGREGRLRLELWCGCCGTLKAAWPTLATGQIVGACPMRHMQRLFYFRHRPDRIQISSSPTLVKIRAFGQTVTIDKVDIDQDMQVAFHPRVRPQTGDPS
jgi:hypothetical protein